MAVNPDLKNIPNLTLTGPKPDVVFGPVADQERHPGRYSVTLTTDEGWMTLAIIDGEHADVAALNAARAIWHALQGFALAGSLREG